MAAIVGGAWWTRGRGGGGRRSRRSRSAAVVVAVCGRATRRAPASLPFVSTTCFAAARHRLRVDRRTAASSWSKTRLAEQVAAVGGEVDAVAARAPRPSCRRRRERSTCTCRLASRTARTRRRTCASGCARRRRPGTPRSTACTPASSRRRPAGSAAPTQYTVRPSPMSSVEHLLDELLRTRVPPCGRRGPSVARHRQSLVPMMNTDDLGVELRRSPRRRAWASRRSPGLESPLDDARVEHRVHHAGLGRVSSPRDGPSDPASESPPIQRRSGSSE